MCFHYKYFLKTQPRSKLMTFKKNNTSTVVYFKFEAKRKWNQQWFSVQLLWWHQQLLQKNEKLHINSIHKPFSAIPWYTLFRELTYPRKTKQQKTPYESREKRQCSHVPTKKRAKIRSFLDRRTAPWALPYPCCRWWSENVAFCWWLMDVDTHVPRGFWLCHQRAKIWT